MRSAACATAAVKNTGRARAAEAEVEQYISQMKGTGTTVRSVAAA